MLSAALTSFLTGVTEPLEFAFMFVAWPLYVIHAVLTGTSLALVNALGIKDGFGFSAGLFDYVLNFNIATKPLLADPDRAGLRRRLLLPVPVRDPQVEPADPGPRGGGRRVRRRGRHERLRMLAALPAGWSPRRGSSRRGGCRSRATRIAEVGPGRPPRPPTSTCPPPRWCRGSSTPTSTAGAGPRSTAATRRRRRRRSRAHLAHGTTTMLASLVTDSPGRAGRLGRDGSPTSSTTACSPASTSRGRG